MPFPSRTALSFLPSDTFTMLRCIPQILPVSLRAPKPDTLLGTSHLSVFIGLLGLLSPSTTDLGLNNRYAVSRSSGAW